MLGRSRPHALIAMAMVCVIAIAVPLFLGLPVLALAGVGVLMALGASLRFINRSLEVARLVFHGVYLLALASGLRAEIR